MVWGHAIAAGANLLGGLIGSSSSKKAAKREYERQVHFAQNAIQWKVDDARKAGIHPVYALGASTHSYAPQAVGNDPMAAGLSAAGQDISRAAHAYKTQSGRSNALLKTMQDLQVKRLGLENELLAAQIRKVNQPGTPPAMPAASPNPLLPGQGDAVVNDVALERTGRDPYRPNREGASLPDVGFARTNTGHAPVPSNDIKQRIEDNLVAQVLWHVRNNLMPTIGLNQSPPSRKNDKGKEWHFHPLHQEYRERSVHSPWSRYFRGYYFRR